MINQRARRAIRLVARRLERDGFAVVVEPGHADMPFDIGSYLPDLIAAKEGESWLVQVNHPGRKVDPLLTRRAVGEVCRHPPWSLRFVAVREDELMIDDSTTGRRLCGRTLRQRLRLLDEVGIHPKTVTLLIPALWTVIVESLKTQMVAAGDSVDGLTDYGVINRGRALGYLYIEEHETLKTLLSQRNDVLHGVSWEMTEAECRVMRDTAETMCSRLPDADDVSQAA